MNTREQDKCYELFIQKYGAYPKIDVTIEAMNDFAKALMQWKRIDIKNVQMLYDAKDDIVSNLANVKMMLRQIELLFQCEGEVEKLISTKIKQQLHDIADMPDESEDEDIL